MKVVLIRDVDKLGRIGETRDVAAGYAYNFLLAKGYALPLGDPRAKKLQRERKEKRTQKSATKVKKEAKPSKSEKRTAKKIKKEQKQKKIIKNN